MIIFDLFHAIFFRTSSNKKFLVIINKVTNIGRLLSQSLTPYKLKYMRLSNKMLLFFYSTLRKK